MKQYNEDSMIHEKIGDIKCSYDNCTKTEFRIIHYIIWIGLLVVLGYFWLQIIFDFSEFEGSNISIVYLFAFPVLYPFILWLWIKIRKGRYYRIYIGDKGFAYYSAKIKTSNECSIYLFRDMSSLRYKKTDNYLNGSYTGTTYFMVFRNLDGKEVFTIENNVSMEILDKLEETWTQFLWNKFISSIEDNSFGLTIKWDDNHLKIGYDYFRFNGIEFTGRDIKNIEITDGFFCIEHQNYETKYWGLKQKGDRISFNINNMPNKLFFLFLFDKLVLHKMT